MANVNLLEWCITHSPVLEFKPVMRQCIIFNINTWRGLVISVLNQFRKNPPSENGKNCRSGADSLKWGYFHKWIKWILFYLLYENWMCITFLSRFVYCSIGNKIWIHCRQVLNVSLPKAINQFWFISFRWLKIIRRYNVSEQLKKLGQFRIWINHVQLFLKITFPNRSQA